MTDKELNDMVYSDNPWELKLMQTQILQITLT